MALSFPSDPINGAVSGEYTYDATKGAWRKNAAYPTSVTHSDVAPSNPRVGDQWWKSNEGTLFTYYNDGTSSQWVESTNVVASSDPNPIPAGAMMAWASDVIPANWLLCDGSAVSRSTYASLFASIGTTYGSGDGTTTFNVPNLKGRTIVGKDASQTEFDALAETGGAKTHTLITAEMPSHIHGTVAHSHTFSGTTSTGGSHSHTVQPQYRLSGGPVQLNGEALTGAPNNGLEGGFNGIRPTGTSADGSHSHTYSGTTSNSAPDTQSAGSGSPHNNLQPYIVLNYIIKFSAGETPGDSQLAVRVGTLETQNNATPLGPNYFINADFAINQRVFSSTTSFGTFGFDRWKMDGAGGTCTYSAQTFTPGNAIAGYEAANFARVVTSGQTDAGHVTLFRQVVEDVRNFAGQTVTVSFYAKAASGTPKVALELEQNFGNGGSPSSAVTIYGGQVTLSTSWARYSLTVPVPSIAGKTIGTTANTSHILCTFIVSAGSNWNSRSGSLGFQTNTFDFWGMQLETGSYATPFRRNQPNIQAELAACQRYFVLFEGGTVEVFNPYFSVALSSGNQRVYTQFPVEMRASPSVLTAAGSALNYFTYFPSNASSNGSILLSMGSSNTKTMTAGFSNSNNGGNSLAAVFATATNTNSIYVSAEF